MLNNLSILFSSLLLLYVFVLAHRADKASKK